MSIEVSCAGDLRRCRTCGELCVYIGPWRSFGRGDDDEGREMRRHCACHRARGETLPVGFVLAHTIADDRVL